MNLDSGHSAIVTAWAEARQFDSTEVDCFTTVMLKILDGKCRMSESGKLVMTLLYDVVKSMPGSLLGQAEHALIAEARAGTPSEEMRMRIYERRLLAETMISRPVMKGFKAQLKAEGVIGGGI